MVTVEDPGFLPQLLDLAITEETVAALNHLHVQSYDWLTPQHLNQIHTSVQDTLRPLFQIPVLKITPRSIQLCRPGLKKRIEQLKLCSFLGTDAINGARKRLSRSVLAFFGFPVFGLQPHVSALTYLIGIIKADNSVAQISEKQDNGSAGGDNAEGGIHDEDMHSNKFVETKEADCSVQDYSQLFSDAISAELSVKPPKSALEKAAKQAGVSNQQIQEYLSSVSDRVGRSVKTVIKSEYIPPELEALKKNGQTNGFQNGTSKGTSSSSTPRRANGGRTPKRNMPKKIQRLTSEQNQILNISWNNNKLQDRSLHDSIAQLCGLKKIQIQKWLYSRNKKAEVAGESPVPNMTTPQQNGKKVTIKSPSQSRILDVAWKHGIIEDVDLICCLTNLTRVQVQKWHWGRKKRGSGTKRRTPTKHARNGNGSFVEPANTDNFHTPKRGRPISTSSSSSSAHQRKRPKQSPKQSPKLSPSSSSQLFSSTQKLILEAAYNSYQLQNSSTHQFFSDVTGVSLKQVKTWYGNRKRVNKSPPTGTGFDKFESGHKKFGDAETKLLEIAYEKGYVDKNYSQKIEHVTNLTYKQIKQWFSNRKKRDIPQTPKKSLSSSKKSLSSSKKSPSSMNGHASRVKSENGMMLPLSDVMVDTNSFQPPSGIVCSCKQQFDPNMFMVCCDTCNIWYHGACENVTEKMSEKIPYWACSRCNR